MGCDIFYQFEVFRDGQWYLLKLLPEMPMRGASDEEWKAYWQHPAYIDRKYPLFGVLGGPKSRLVVEPPKYIRGQPNPVRAESMLRWPRLAAVPPPQQYLSDPLRGLPPDASEPVKAEWERVKLDLYPALSVTLATLLEFDWQQECYDLIEEKKVNCAEATAPFSQTFLPYLCEFADDPNDFRMVYWFGC